MNPIPLIDPLTGQPVGYDEKKYSELYPAISDLRLGSPPRKNGIESFGSDMLIDPRTNLEYGQRTEDEIDEDLVKQLSTAIAADIPLSSPKSRNMFKGIEIDENAEKRELRTNIAEVSKDRISAARKEAKLRNLAVSWRTEEDPVIQEGYQKEIETLRSEITKIYEKWPVGGQDDVGIFREIIDLTVTFGGQMSMAGKEVSAGVASAGVTGGAVAGVPGTLYGAGVGFLGGMFSYQQKQMEGGMIYAGMQAGIDKDIIAKYSVPSSFAAALVDMVGFRAMLGNIKLGKGIGERIVNVAKEGETEVVQGMVENLSLELMKKEQAERAGKEYEVTWDNIVQGSQEQARAGILTAGGISAPSTAVDSYKAIKEYNTKYLQAEKKVKVSKAIQEAKLENRQVQNMPTKPSINLEGEVVESAPVTEIEKVSAMSKRTDVDQKADDIVVMESAEAEAAIDAVVNEALEGSGNLWADFQAELRTIVNEEQATELESLIDRRAEALGITTEQYFKDRRITMVNTQVENPDAFATVTFKEEGEAIIKAYQGANISSIAHEIGHIFRRDIQGEDLRALEKFVGVDKGAIWDVAAEEKFAIAWEKYLASNVAPSPELTGTFQKFTAWMTNIYEGLKGSPMDVQFSPEVRQVFDNLLVKRSTANHAANLHKQMSMTLQQEKPSAALETEKKWEEKASAAETIRKDITKAKVGEKAALIEELQRIVTEMKRMLDSTDRFGYETARAEFKVTLERARNRGRMQKRVMALKKKLLKRVKSAQVKGKKPKGITNYDDQKFLEELYTAFLEVSKLKDATQFIIELTDSDWYDATGVDYYKNRFADAATRRNEMGLELMQELYNDVSDLIERGKDNSPFSLAKQASDAIVEKAVDQAIGGGVNLSAEIREGGPEKAYRTRKGQKTFWERMATLGLGKDLVFGWGGLMDVISAYTPAGEVSVMRKSFNFYENRQAQMTEIRETFVDARDWFMEANGFTNKLQVEVKMRKDAREDKDIGLRDLYSTSQIRQMWMYLKDPALIERLENQGITAEVATNIDNFMGANPQEMAFANRLLEYWNSDNTYNAINEVYKRLMGADLPRLDFYVPIRSQAWQTESRVGLTEDVLGQLSEDYSLRRTPSSSGHLKGRLDKTEKAPIFVGGDVGMFNGYVDEMAHFKAYAEKIRIAKLTIENRRFRNAVTYEYGKDILDVIDSHLGDISADGSTNATVVQAVDKFRSAFVVSSIGMNAGVMLKQLISVANYWQNMPASEYVVGFMDTPTLFKNMKALGEGDYLQNRQNNIDRDMKALQNSKEFQRFKANPTFKNLMMLNVRIGDALAIKLGGAVYMRYLMKPVNAGGKGMTKKAAMALVGEVSDNTQQSGVIEQLPKVQRAGSFGKLFTMYSTGPVQAARQLMEAQRGVARAHMRGDGKSEAYGKFIKTLVIYQFFVPAMYSAAASFISDDEEWEKSMALSMALGPFGSMYSGGRLLANFARRAVNMPYYQTAGPLEQTLMDAANVISKMNPKDIEDISLDDGVKAIEGTLNLFGVGVTLQKPYRMAANALELDYKGAAFGTKPEE